MEPKNFALYNKQTGLIDNILLIDPDIAQSLPDFPPEGFGLVQLPEYTTEQMSGEWSHPGIGWSYINGQFVEPQQP